MLTLDAVGRWFARRRGVAGALGVLVWIAWLVGCAFGATNGNWQNIRLGFAETDAAGTVIGMDHLAFYAPARRVLEGRGGEIYDLESTARHQATLLEGDGFEGKLLAFRNPPFFALLYLPTARLPYLASVWVWTILGLLGYTLAAYWLAPTWWRRAWFWGLTFVPTFCVVGFGQSSHLSLLVFAGCYKLLKSGHTLAAGLAASLLWFKPPLLIGLLLWWALDLKAYWRALAGVVLGGGLLYALTVPFVPDAWAAFWVSLADNARFDSFEWWKAHSARAFWRLLLTPEAAPLPTILWLTTALATVGWFARVRRHHRANPSAMMAAAVVLTLFASPHVMVYDWAILLAAGWLVWDDPPIGRDRLWGVTGLVWCAFFVSTEFAHLQEFALVRLTGTFPPPGVVQVSQLAIAYALAVTWPRTT